MQRCGTCLRPQLEVFSGPITHAGGPGEVEVCERGGWGGGGGRERGGGGLWGCRARGGGGGGENWVRARAPARGGRGGGGGGRRVRGRRDGCGVGGGGVCRRATGGGECLMEVGPRAAGGGGGGGAPSLPPAFAPSKRSRPTRPHAGWRGRGWGGGWARVRAWWFSSAAFLAVFDR